MGGNTNFAIAAARIGLRCACLGHTGADSYGAFLQSVLADEGVALMQLLGRGAPCQGMSSRPVEPLVGSSFHSLVHAPANEGEGRGVPSHRSALPAACDASAGGTPPGRLPRRTTNPVAPAPV